MSDSIILRVMSQAGRSRIEMPKTNQYKDLKAEIAKRLNLDPASLKLFKDQAFKQPIRGTDRDTLERAGLKHGDILHVSNAGTQMTQLPQKKEFVSVKTEEELKKEAEDKGEKLPDKPMVDSYGRALKAPEVKEVKENVDYYGRQIKAPVKET